MRYETYNSTEVFFLESVADRGVSFVKWDEFVRVNNIYSEIFVRKLHCTRDDAFYDTLESFLDQVQGNKYGLNLGNILFSKQKGSMAITKGKQLEDRSFFCSELAIKCYKELGLVTSEKASSQFTPGDLSMNSQTGNDLIKFKDGCYLEVDKMIIID